MPLPEIMQHHTGTNDAGPGINVSNPAASDVRLLSGVRSALRSLGALCEGAEVQQVANSANALLDELILRTDREFYGRYVAAGVALLRQTPAALLAQLAPTDRQLIEQTLQDAGQASSEYAGTDFTTLRGPIEQLRMCFEIICSHLSGPGQRSGAPLLGKLLGWEAELYARSAQFKTEPPKEAVSLTLGGLQQYLRAKFPNRPDIRVTTFQPLSGGFQKLTVLFETQDEAGGHQSLVLRGEQPDRFIMLELGEIPDEYEVVKIAYEAGLPVAEPLWLETDTRALGRRFMISRRVPGVNYGTVVGIEKAMPDQVARAFVTTLAQLHRTPLSRYADQLSRTRIGHWLEHKSLAQNTLANVNRWRDMLELRPHASSPTLSALYTWLVANVPEGNAAACLLHCDYGPHNVLIDSDRVSGILDWEVARIGDPAEDLAYFLQATAGQVDRQQMLRWYEEAGGSAISDFRLRYFEVFGAFQLMVGCLAANALYARDEMARNVWMIAARWAHVPIGLALPRIAAAEAAKHGGRNAQADPA